MFGTTNVAAVAEILPRFHLLASASPLFPNFKQDRKKEESGAAKMAVTRTTKLSFKPTSGNGGFVHLCKQFLFISHCLLFTFPTAKHVVVVSADGDYKTSIILYILNIKI